jgi:GNAT superfamily N-acetyltransferase
MRKSELEHQRIIQKVDTVIRLMEAKDVPAITNAFETLGWNKLASQYERYLAEQDAKVRDVYVAWANGEFAGYLTICWKSTYTPFRDRNIPEIVDLNVLPKFRRLWIGSQLMDQAEQAIANISSVAGIGVGMTADYGPAQRMYVVRGYVPDGLGLHARDHHVRYGEQITVDDDLVLYLTKDLT